MKTKQRVGYWIVREFVQQMPEYMRTTYESWIRRPIKVGDVYLSREWLAESPETVLADYKRQVYGPYIDYSIMPNDCVKRLKLQNAFYSKEAWHQIIWLTPRKE